MKDAAWALGVLALTWGCSTAQLVRGRAELATQAPETALMALTWVATEGAQTQRAEAEGDLPRAKNELQRVLDQHAAGTWLVIEQDFADNFKFGPSEHSVRPAFRARTLP